MLGAPASVRFCSLLMTPSPSPPQRMYFLSDPKIFQSEKLYITVGLFIDLSKAFDTVDHNIFLNRLSLYGIKSNNFTWFPS